MIKIYKYKNIIINCILCLIIVMLLLFISMSTSEVITITEVVYEEKEVYKEKEKLYVSADVKGEVVNEGVYELEKGSRVIDFINEAGGFKRGANTININLSRVVSDQDLIYVFDNEFFDETVLYEEIVIVKDCVCPDVTYEEVKEEESGGLININIASKELLMTLPGVGEKRALDIIEYRENEPFLNIEDIKNVSGIGEASYNNIKKLITV